MTAGAFPRSAVGSARPDLDPEDGTVSDQKARDVMSTDCTCIGENDSVLDAAKRLAEKDVGSLPICGDDDRRRPRGSDLGRTMSA